MLEALECATGFCQTLWVLDYSGPDEREIGNCSSSQRARHCYLFDVQVSDVAQNVINMALSVMLRWISSTWIYSKWQKQSRLAHQNRNKIAQRKDYRFPTIET